MLAHVSGRSRNFSAVNLELLHAQKTSQAFQRNVALVPTETLLCSFSQRIAFSQKPSCRRETAPRFVSFENYSVLFGDNSVRCSQGCVEDQSDTPCLRDMKCICSQSACCVTSQYLSLQVTFRPQIYTR